MLFTDFNFWLIFPIIFSIYWLIPQDKTRIRQWWLIIVSYLLYINWKASFAIILFSITIITFYGGQILEKNKNKKTASFLILASLSPLLLFKYYNFINENVTSILHQFGLSFHIPGLNWAIPIGISFFTFQAVGYMLDVYFDKIKAERSFSCYLLFCSFFPQTVSGPISKGSELLPQLKSLPTFNYNNGVKGLQFLLWGLFLKCVLADRLGGFVDIVFNNYERFSGANCLIASFFYSIQIYGDFAGYSLMAVGIAKLLNINIINNFKRPYLAESITSFWRRWHISLTRWLTSYVYIPLGGSRCSKIRQYFNIMITFIVSGVWHGANWTFIFWGAIHGIFQIIEKILGIDPKGKFSNSLFLQKIKPLRIMLTFILVSFAWIFFRSATLNDALSFINRFFTEFGGQPLLHEVPPNQKVFFIALIFIVSFADIYQEFLKNRFSFLRNSAILRWIYYIFLFVTIATCSVLDAGQFIYVSF